MSHALRRRWAALTEDLQAQKKVLVAFSAGCDSTFLLSVARYALPRENILAVTAISASLAAHEKQAAACLAEQLDVEHLFLQTEEIKNPDYAANSPNRCFFCKDELFEKLTPVAQAREMKIVDGLNLSDLSEYRPGVRAAEKWGVQHPLKEARLTKWDIRVLSRWRQLPTWKKAASPCLSSRIPYGTRVTERILRQVERAENILLEENFDVVRVRHYGTQARIEVPLADLPRLQEKSLWAHISRRFQAIGYRELVLDPRGFRSGSLNEGIQNAPLLRSEVFARAF